VQVIMFDPGNYTPHYVGSLCTALALLDAKVELITSPPLFEDSENNRSFCTQELFFPSVSGARRQFLRRHASLRQALKALSYPLGLWRTWNALKSRPPGIFHVQWALIPALDALLLRKLRSRAWRVVYTAHEVITDLSHPLSRPQWRWMFQNTDAVVVHTASLAQILRDHGEDVLSAIREIPEGISSFSLSPDVDRNRARQILGLDSGAPVLLFFGLIKPYKGLEFLLRAWPRVLAEFPNSKLLIAGEPMMPFQPYRRLIDDLKIEDSVVLKLGYVPSAEVQYLFCAADAVVIPYVKISTSGVVPIAYRYARPVIGTSVGGMPEIVNEGQTGFLVPPCSEQPLAEAICRGLRNPSMLAEMGARGREWLETEHSWKQVACRTFELYRTLLE
jgi:glycosyltransferase involved in cell wall biosynthesis